MINNLFFCIQSIFWNFCNFWIVFDCFDNDICDSWKMFLNSFRFARKLRSCLQFRNWLSSYKNYWSILKNLKKRLIKSCKKIECLRHIRMMSFLKWTKAWYVLSRFRWIKFISIHIFRQYSMIDKVKLIWIVLTMFMICYLIKLKCFYSKFS